MRTITRLGLVLAGLLFYSTAAFGQVRINEVGYAGVDVQGQARWVELYNAGAESVDVSDFWLCNFPNYSQVSTLTVLQGSTTLDPGAYLVVAFDGAGDGDGEVGLYTVDTFDSADAIMDYVQYGSAGHQREPVAATAGVWETGAFVMPAAAGEALAFVGGGTAADNWSSRSATPGQGNGADPMTAARASIDRFSEAAGTLFVRDATNGLPAADAPVDFDQGPFITRGLGPDGTAVQYYNFDVQPTEPAPIYVLFHEGEAMPVPGQLNIVDDIPGDDDYNDFWQVVKVTVPANYVANTITSLEGLMAADFPMEPTDLIVNCPVVPEGSTASLRLASGNSAGLVQGWYRDELIFYFDFSEAMLTSTASGMVPVSPIYVAFNINPGQDGGGPPSGFMTEENSVQTHNVVSTVPGDAGYSPLWVVNIYDNADFATVLDLATAQAATQLAAGAALVNCPIVSVDTGTAVEQESGEVPQGFILHGNYPNPFNPETVIRYELAEAGRVTLRVYTLLGERVADLVAADQPAGVYRVTWDGRDANGQRVATGVYLYRLLLDGQASRTRTMTLIK